MNNMIMMNNMKSWKDDDEIEVKIKENNFGDVQANV